MLNNSLFEIKPIKQIKSQGISNDGGNAEKEGDSSDSSQQFEYETMDMYKKMNKNRNQEDIKVCKKNIQR